MTTVARDGVPAVDGDGVPAVVRDRFASLPDFPWDTLAAAKAVAAAHPGGIVDLSIGTPVDPTSAAVQAALSAAADAPGYPTVHGTVGLRTAFRDWAIRRVGATRALEVSAVLPTVGSKEAVSSLPTQLGLGPGDRVAVPALAYPTYEVGALAAGAEIVRYDPLAGLPDGPLALVWLNSPANPTGAVLDLGTTRSLVAAARARGAVVASDECYAEFGWDAHPVSVLDPRVHAPAAAPTPGSRGETTSDPTAGTVGGRGRGGGRGGGLAGLLALHSLSKQANLAGYRVGFLSGDPVLVARLLAIRKQLGLIVPWPVQQAAITALADDPGVGEQRARYAARRSALLGALRSAGLTVQDSAGALYLWATAGEPAMDTVDRLATLGVLVAPGSFYGPAGASHVRVAVTATDERVDAAVQRLG